MRPNILKALLVVAALSSGCASAYTSISKNEDGSYTLTKNSQTFIRVKGTVFHCTPQGQGLNCAEVDSP